MRTFTFAFVAAIVGVFLSWGVMYGAASSWSTFSDRWMTAAALLPILGTLGGAWVARKTGHHPAPWPIKEMGTRLGLAVMGAAFGFLGSYVAFAIVSVIWNHVDVGAHGGVVALLLDPEKIPALSQARSTGTATSLSAVGQGGLGAFCGGLVTFMAAGRKG